MVDVAAELSGDDELQRAIATSSLQARQEAYAANKTIKTYCRSCFAPLSQVAILCAECEALATKGWLPPIV
jgi:hypothetical protein